MRTLLTLSFLALFMTGYAQLHVNPVVAQRYEEVLNQMDLNYRKMIEDKARKGFSNFKSITIFTKYQADTLNKDQFVKNNVSLQDASTGQILNSANESIVLIPLPSNARIVKDTLLLAIAGMFPPYILHKVKGFKTISSYYEDSSGENIFRLNLNQSKARNISIPVKTIKFEISENEFKPGDLIFGEVEAESAPYYVEDSMFKNGYIKKRLVCKYVFKMQIAEL